MRRHLLPTRILLLSVLICVPYSAAPVAAASRRKAQRQQRKAVRPEPKAEKRQVRSERPIGKTVGPDRKLVRPTRSGWEQKVKAEKPRKQRPSVTNPDVAKSAGDRPRARPPAVRQGARTKPSQTAEPSEAKSLSHQSDQKRAGWQDPSQARVRTQRPQRQGSQPNRFEPGEKETPRKDARSTPRRDAVRPADRTAPHPPSGQSQAAGPSGTKSLSRQSDRKRAGGQVRNPAPVRTQWPQPQGIRQNRPEPSKKETPRERARGNPRGRDAKRPADRNASRQPVITPGASDHRRGPATERRPVRPDGDKDRSGDHRGHTGQKARDHTNTKRGSRDGSGFRAGLHIGGDGFGVSLNYRDGGVIRRSGSFRHTPHRDHPRRAVVHLQGLGHYYRPHHRRYDRHDSHYGRYHAFWLYSTVFVYRPAPVVVEQRVIVIAPTTVSVKPNDVYIATQNKLMDQVLHEDTEQRIAAARELGEYRNISSVAVLIDVLVNDAEATVRVEAADSLGRIGDPVAYEALLRIAEADIDEHVRDTAEHSARKIEEGIDVEGLHVSDVFPPMNQGDERLGEYLEDLRFGSRLIREHAAENLVEHRGTQAVAALINVLINDCDTDVRLAAARSLRGMGDRMAVPFMEVAAANDESTSVRREAERAAETITD